MIFKKTVSLITLVAMIFFIIPTMAFAADFNDTKGHWANAVITKWNQKGLVVGSNGRFVPDNSITRAEFSAMLNKIMNYSSMAENRFKDLSENKWYYNDMLKLVAAGVMNGSNGRLYPENKITRQEAMVLVAKAFSIQVSGIGSDSTGFVDNNEIAVWARGACSKLVQLGYIKGNNGRLNPESDLSRAEAVQILDNIAKELFNIKGEFSKDVNGNVVVNTPDVTLKNMQISGSLYITEGVGEGEVRLEGVNVKGDLIVKGGGQNSVYFNNANVEGSLVVNKVGGNIRIVASGDSQINVCLLQSGAILIEQSLTGGGFEKVEISAEDAKDTNVVLNGTFTSVDVNSAVKIENQGTITNFNINAESTVENKGTIAYFEANSKVIVNGTGTVTEAKVNANASGSTFVAAPVTTKLAPGTSATVNGSESTNTGDSTSTITNGSSGGSSGGSTPSNVSVTGISLSSTSSNVEVGQTITLTPTISPSNATNKNVSWSTSNSSIATVVNGAVYGVLIGQATVTATTEDGSMTATCLITVRAPAPPENPNAPKFISGWPKAEIDANGYIVIKAKIDIPGHVYAVVDRMNATNSNPIVEDILHGHDGYYNGTKQTPLYNDDEHIFNLAANEEGVYLTTVKAYAGRTTKIYFVAMDNSSPPNVQSNLSAITLNGTFQTETDVAAPSRRVTLINQARNEIRIFFNEALHQTPPDTTVFAVTYGATGTEYTANVNSVSISNPQGLITTSYANYVSVSIDPISIGLTDIVKVSYTKPATNPIQDTAVVPNAAASFTVNASTQLPVLTSAYLDNNLSVLTVNFESGIDFSTGLLNDANLFTLTGNNGQIGLVRNTLGWGFYDYTVRFDLAPHTSTSNFRLSLSQPAVSYFQDFAGDKVLDFANQPVTQDTALPTVLSAEVTGSGVDQSLDIQFNEQLHNAALYNCALTITVNGTGYKVIGFSSVYSDMVSISGLPVVIAAGDTVTVSYQPVHTLERFNGFICDVAGNYAASFVDQPVTNNVP